MTTITFRISGETNDTDSILVSIFTIFEAEKPKNDKRIYVELTRDLESDCAVTISVTCRISSNTDATDSILVSISPYSRPRNSKMVKLSMHNSRVT